MALHGMLLFTQLTIISLVLVAIGAASDRASPPQALPGCPDRCGNLTIQYPFGIGNGCYQRESFSITCNESAQPATAALWADGSSIIATNISLAEGELQISNKISYDCYDKQGNQTKSMHDSPLLQLHPPFTISGTRNNFTKPASNCH